VKIGFCVTRNQERRILTVTCTLAIPAVIFCVPTVSILNEDFARGVEDLTIGSLCRPNYFRKTRHREQCARMGQCLHSICTYYGGAKVV
jgi:hypothetical protein